ncbi:hypothetical protein [Streptomyces sp. NPDC048606]|uniref:hypothetical protein n=1 Tax=Streptomyces sp. NPDC048606 TaxID=3154726 RepID=UPI003425A0B5
MRHRHYGLHIQAVAVAFVICTLPLTYATPLGLLVTAFGQTVFGLSALTQLRHHFGPPCTECVKEMPLDPQEAAEEHRGSRWALRASHSLFGSLPTYVVSLALLLILSFGPLYGAVGLGDVAWIASVFLVLALCLTLGINWVARTHNRLLLWCPYCPDDDEGDDESPTPTPTDGRDQPVPA